MKHDLPKYEELAEKVSAVATDVWKLRNEALSLESNEEADDLLFLHDSLFGIARELAWKPEFEDEPLTGSNLAAKVREEVAEAITNGTYTSISHLAEVAGLSRTAIEGVMNGKTANPRAKTLRALEEALGLSEGELDA